MPRNTQYLEHLARVPLFSACTKRELQQLARRTTILQFRVGQELITEGTIGYEFFVIIEGEADVVRGGKKVAALGPGAFFGELAILDLAPRDATVVASTPMEAVVLSRDDFRQALVEVPAMTIRLLAGMARRLREFDLTR